GSADLPHLVETRAHDGGDREQEREAGGGLPVVAEEQAGADRRTGPGDAGDEGEGLGESDGGSVANAEVVQVLAAIPDPIGEGEHEAEEDQGGGDQSEVTGPRFDLVLEHHAEETDRD